MQGLPFTRDLTMIPGVSEFPARTGNALQDGVVGIWRALRGSDWLLSDDFNGSALDTGRWAISNAAVVNDLSADARGIAQVAATAVADGSIAPNGVLSLNGRDWIAFARVKFMTRAAWSAGGFSSFGVEDLVSGYNIVFKAPNAGNLQAIYGVGAGTVVDLGVVPDEAGYQTLELRSLGGTVSWLVNGVVKFTLAIAADLLQTAAAFSAKHGGTAGDGKANVDKLSFWAGSLPISAAPSGGPHEEPFWSATTDVGAGNGVDYYDVVFATPYAFATGANGYTTYVELYRSDGGPNVSYTILNKTVNGFRINFDAPFVGEVRGRAIG